MDNTLNEDILTADEFIQYLESEEINYDRFGSLMNIAWQYCGYCEFDRTFRDTVAASRVEDLILTDMQYSPGMGDDSPEDHEGIRMEMFPRVADDMDLWHIGMYINEQLDAIPEDEKY
jgi:hypothetical protein